MDFEPGLSKIVSISLIRQGRNGIADRRVLRHAAAKTGAAGRGSRPSGRLAPCRDNRARGQASRPARRFPSPRRQAGRCAACILTNLPTVTVAPAAMIAVRRQQSDADLRAIDGVHMAKRLGRWRAVRMLHACQRQACLPRPCVYWAYPGTNSWRAMSIGLSDSRPAERDNAVLRRAFCGFRRQS